MNAICVMYWVRFSVLFNTAILISHLSAEENYRESIFRENCIIVVEGEVSGRVHLAKIPHQDENGDIEFNEYAFSSLEISNVKFSALDLGSILPIFKELFTGNVETVSIPIFWQRLDSIVSENKVKGIHILQYSPGSWGFFKDVFLQTQDESEISRLIEISLKRKLQYIPGTDF